MAATKSKEKYNALLQFSKMSLEDVPQTIEEGEMEDIQLCYTRICTLIDKLEKSIDEIVQRMLDEEHSLETIKQWTAEQKQQLKDFRQARTNVKHALERSREQDEEKQIQREVEKQRAVNEEIKRARLQQQREIDEARIRQQQQEEEWLTKKLELETRAKTTEY